MRKYIAFEGLDLSGKTTIINNIKLKRSEYIYTKEPGGFNNDLSLKIRDLILNYKDEIDPIVETYLFAASRAIDMKETKKYLENDKVVISDRSYYTSMFYQGVLKRLGLSTVKDINKYALNGIEPDIIFYITVDEKDRLKRIKNRKTLNRLDEETLAIDYFKNNLLYLEMLKNMSAANIYVINTSKYDMDIVVNKIINIIEKE